VIEVDPQFRDWETGTEVRKNVVQGDLPAEDRGLAGGLPARRAGSVLHYPERGNHEAGTAGAGPSASSARARAGSGMATHSGKESALELLLEQPARLENGLVVLDRRLPLDESVEVDALLRDALGYPVVVLFCKGEIGPELGRMAAVVAGLQRGRYLLARLYGDKGLDATLRPRFVLLGSRFADDASALLDMMSGVEVHALEYRVVTGNNGQQVLDLASFHRTSGPTTVASNWRGSELASPPALSPAPASAAPSVRPLSSVLPNADAGARPGSPASASGAMPGATSAGSAAGSAASRVPTSGAAQPPVAPRLAGAAHGDELHLIDEDAATPDLARSYFLRARDSIRSLSSHVSENSDNGRLRYRVADADLATLSLDAGGFQVQVGDGGDSAGAPVRVTDEATFNERLNAVFTLYFNRLGPDRPPA